MRWVLRGSVCLVHRLRSRTLPHPSVPRAKYTQPPRHRLVLSGVLAWLGFSQQSEPDHDLIITIKRGILAAQEGDLKRADQIFHIALKMAADIDHREAETHIYSLLANTAQERGFPGQAERLFTEVLKRILGAGEPQDSNTVVEVSLKLAEIFHAQREYGKAEQGFEFCTKTQQKKLEVEGSEASEDTLALYGLALDRQGQFLLGRGRLAEAETAFQSAVQVSSRVHGADHEQTLVILNSLATVLSLKGENTKSISLLSDVISRAEGTSCRYLPTFLINRGIVSLRAGLRSAAEADCTKAKMEAGLRKDQEATDEAEDCLAQLLNLKN